MWAELIDVETSPELRRLYVARREFGIGKYKQPVRRGDGRDRVQDLVEEVLDAMVYAQDLRWILVVWLLRLLLIFILWRSR